MTRSRQMAMKAIQADSSASKVLVASSANRPSCLLLIEFDFASGAVLGVHIANGTPTSGGRVTIPPQLRAARAGEEGFVSFIKALQRLGVLDRDDVHAWLGFHGAVTRATEKPLDDGATFDEQAFAELERELGAS